MQLLRSDLDSILEQAKPSFEALRGEEVFLTGGTGFFGAWLLESFAYANLELALNAEITVLTRSPDAFRAKMPHLAGNAAIHLLEGDVRDFDFPEGKFRYVIHAATEASAKLSAENPGQMLSTILAGTERTLEFARTHGAKRFLLTSSGAVYGKQPSAVVHLSEEYEGGPDPLLASSVYAEGKRGSELMCAIEGKISSMECLVARCWAFCGPHLPLDTHFAIGNFVRDVMAGGPIRIGGDGTPTRSYLYAGDLAAWLWTMLTEAAPMRAYNVGSAYSVSILELAQAVRDALGSKCEIEVAGKAATGAPVSRYVPDVSRITKELNVRETVSLAETVRRTAAWYGWKT